MSNPDIVKVELQIAKLQQELNSWRSVLPEKTLIILLSHSTKLPHKTVKKLLDGIDNIYVDYFETE